MKKEYGIIIMILASMLSTSVNYAASTGTPKLMQSETDEKAIHLFVKGMTKPEEITCRFGTHVCTEIGWHSLTEVGEGRETLVLIDNSLSTGRRYREKIEEVVLKLFEHASENEKFCLATFGETTEYLTEYTNLYSPLEEAMLEIEYYDRETYMTDAVMEAMELWDTQKTEPVYRRIIVVSDGLEAASLEHTHEELYLRLKEDAYPVYTIGCIGKDKSALSHMAVLSRMTGAAAYILDQDTDAEEISMSLLEDRDVLHVTMIPEPEWMDGSEKNAKLMFLKKGEISNLDVCLQMPFQPEEQREEQGVSPAEEPKIEEIPIPVISEPPAEEKETIGVAETMGIMLGVLLVLIGIYILILYLAEKRRRQAGAEDADTGRLPGYDGIRDPSPDANREEEWSRYENSDTQLLRAEDEEGDSRTTLLFAEEEVYEMMLTDQSNPAKFFSFPIRDSVIIGRSARSSHIILDYDASVSGRHCEIENRGGRFFVRDLQSSNGTRVNGIKVLSETELFIGNLLKIGQVEMKVGWSMHG